MCDSWRAPHSFYSIMRYLSYALIGIAISLVAAYAIHIVPKEHAGGVVVIFVTYTLLILMLVSYMESKARQDAAVQLAKYEHDREADQQSG